MDFDYMDFDPEVFAGIWAAAMVFALAMVIPIIFYLLTLQRTVAAVSPGNRELQPGHVWMLFIPVYGIIWNFMMVHRIAVSLRKEFDARGILYPDQKPGYSMGLTAAILLASCAIPFVNFLAFPTYVVFWIIYWVKIAGCKKLLEAQTGGEVPASS